MQSQLEQLEKDSGIEWQDYLIDDLFEVGTGSLVDIKSAKTGQIPRISVQTTNNGVYGYFSKELENSRYFENFVSVNFFGIAFYHPYCASVEMKVHTLRLKNRELTQSLGLFFAGVLNKRFEGLFSYGAQLSSSKLKSTGLTIQLPTITKNGKPQIAFEFIENFFATLNAERLATLNAERLATLNAYLIATDLKDYTLTTEEQAALDKSDKVTFGVFNLEKLFGKTSRGRRLKSADRIDGTLPFVTAGETATGISAWIGNVVHVYSKNTVTIDMFGSAKYRDYDYGADDHVAIVHTESLPKFAVLYLTAAIHKSSHAGQFDYSRNFYASDADALNISLPIKPDNTPDYDYMAHLIAAMQKVVIKKVVDYLDLRILKTDELIKSE
jgi:hypothetical protein